MVKSHAASHTAPLKVCCSIRIFRLSSPCVSVPTDSLRNCDTAAVYAFHCTNLG